MDGRDLTKLCRPVVMCLVLLAALGGCNNPPSVNGEGAGSKTGVAPVQAVTGTVRHIDLEGSFYGIVTDDGKKLDPVNLPQEFQKDGLRIWARVEPLPDRVSIHMWGTLVRIVEFKRL